MGEQPLRGVKFEVGYGHWIHLGGTCLRVNSHR